MKRANPRKLEKLGSAYKPIARKRRSVSIEIRLRQDPLYNALETLIIKLGGSKWGLSHKIGRFELILSKKFAGKSLAEIKKTLPYKKAVFAFRIMKKIEQDKLTVAEALNAAMWLLPKKKFRAFAKRLGYGKFVYGAKNRLF